jgi:hypothetical protein
MRQPKVTGYGGKYDKFLSDEHWGGTVEWQPGDGTRYLLVAKGLDADEARLFGAPPGAMLVAVGSGGEQMLALALEPDSLHHLTWVMEQAGHMKVSEYTLMAYTALLNLVLGNEAYGEELFERHIKGRG